MAIRQNSQIVYKAAKRILVCTAILTISLASTSSALFLGQMRSAETSGWGSLNLMPQVGVFKHAALVAGSVRYGLASPVDATATLAIMDHDSSDDPGLLLGGDIQWRVTHVEFGSPLDMAVGAGAEYYSLNLPADRDLSSLAVGINFVASRPVKIEEGPTFTPYGRLNMSVLNDLSDHGSGDDSEFQINVSLGTVFPLSNKVSLVGELQIHDPLGFLAGVNFFIW